MKRPGFGVAEAFFMHCAWRSFEGALGRQTTRSQHMRGERSFGGVWVWLLALSLFLGAATGCNTVKGIGKDIRSLGGAIERSADGAK